jgi:hypothetical protein
MFAGDFGVGQLLWTFLWFFLFFMWISLVIYIFGDIIRDKETKGAVKAFWTLFIIILPYIGVLVYLIARGNGMAERSVRTAKAQDDAFRDYVQSAAGGSAQQLATLADLLDRGKITQAEYDDMKKKIVQS